MAEIQNKVSGRGMVTKNNVFIFPSGEELKSEDINGFVNYNEQLSSKYNKYYSYYIGNHDILKGNRQVLKPDNRVVVNFASYIVDTFVGFFVGKTPQITLNSESDSIFQDWINKNSFKDKLSDLAKQVDIYGKAYIMLYSVDNDYKVTILDPVNSFIVYDDTVDHNPVAFVRYQYDGNNQFKGWLYTEKTIRTIGASFELGLEEINPIQAIPAFEFYTTQERISMIGKVISLIDAYDKAISQKANQNEYFDNAYLKILGIPLEIGEDGEPRINIDGNNIIYSPDNSENGQVEFLSKPDGDNMQENLLNRLLSDMYQTSMVPNLTDKEFSGNASGVAIKYKMQPMINLSSVKERKFIQKLRDLFNVLFTNSDLLPNNVANDIYKDLSFKFVQNMPINLSDEASTAATLSNLVSQETMLSTLSIIDSPKLEIERIDDERTRQLKKSMANSPSSPDFIKNMISDNDGDNVDEDTEQQ